MPTLPACLPAKAKSERGDHKLTQYNNKRIEHRSIELNPICINDDARAAVEACQCNTRE
jgi:hypothetical protein